jgi:hypothetical protein
MLMSRVLAKNERRQLVVAVGRGLQRNLSVRR